MRNTIFLILLSACMLAAGMGACTGALDDAGEGNNITPPIGFCDIEENITRVNSVPVMPFVDSEQNVTVTNGTRGDLTLHLKYDVGIGEEAWAFFYSNSSCVDPYIFGVGFDSGGITRVNIPGNYSNLWLSVELATKDGRKLLAWEPVRS